jgi:uncharacterized protein YndB with AHSA1/START domain
MKTLISGLMLAVAIASPAAAEVKAADDNGFAIAWTASVAAPPAEVWAALGQIGRWWNGEHSYSGDASNMTIELKAGGCFCETLPKVTGSVEHAHVVQALPPSVLRLTGGLGPLQSMPVNAVMDWTLKPSGSGTELAMTYVVGGPIPGGGKALAPLVDQVLGEQFRRLTVFVRKPR